MVEIIGSKYCQACSDVRRTLDARSIPYTFHDVRDFSERYRHLSLVADDDGEIYHPIAFWNGECIGSGHSVLDRIDKLIEE